MKKVLSIAVASIFAFSSMVIAGEKRGFLEKANNKVEIKVSNSWKNAKSGQKIFVGDSIRTGLRSTAEIKYDDDTRTRIGSRSNIVVADRKINIMKGYIWGKVDKRKTKGLKIITSNAIASIVGTEFFVEVEDKNTIITVLEGEISFEANKKDATKKTSVKAGSFAKIDVNGNVIESGPMDTPKVLAKYDELVHFNTDGAVQEK